MFLRRISPRIRIGIATMLGVALLGCAPSIKREGYVVTPSDKDINCKIAFRKQAAFRGEEGTVLGTMKVGDSGLSSKCSEEDVMRILRAEGCKLGAQIIVLRDIKEPGIMSSCYQVTADFISLKDAAAVRDTLAQAHAPFAPQDSSGDNEALKVLAYVLGAAAGFAIGFLLFQ